MKQRANIMVACREYQDLLEESVRAREIWDERRAEISRTRLAGKETGDELLRLQAKYARAYSLLQKHVHTCLGASSCRELRSSRQTKGRFVTALFLAPPSQTGISCPRKERHMFICNPQECAHCGSPIVSGQRWVREKIYEPVLVGQDPRYHRYHADLFTGEEVSCWEKHLMQQEIVRTTARAA